MNKIYLCILTLLTACATSDPRTKWTDRAMRIMVDPASIDADNHVLIEQALVESGKWFVVNRSSGFEAIKTEQERLHRGENDRFDDHEKWALWGRLYGVGGVVTAAIQCRKTSQFITGYHYLSCRQFLSIVDANTGEIIASVQAQNKGDEPDMLPTWNDTVASLNQAFPADFKPSRMSPKLTQYREVAAEEAQRQRESMAAK